MLRWLLFAALVSTAVHPLPSDTVAVVVRNGVARLELDSARHSVLSSGTRRVCAWMVTTTGLNHRLPVKSA